MKPLACLTIARNESHFLPIWLRHYGATGGDLVLLDHENDPSELTSALDECVASRFPLTVVPVGCPRSDDVHWMRSVVEAQVDELLGEYRTVVFAEVDELLVPDPSKYPSGLSQYLGEHQAWIKKPCPDHEGRFHLECPACNAKNATQMYPRLTATGYEVIPDDRWVRNDQYDKTLIVRQPTRWEVGFHRPLGERPEPDPSLVLIHLHYRSREVAWNRLVARQRGKDVVQDGLGFQNKFRDRVTFDGHFDEVCHRPSEPIPERLLPFCR